MIRSVEEYLTTPFFPYVQGQYRSCCRFHGMKISKRQLRSWPRSSESLLHWYNTFRFPCPSHPKTLEDNVNHHHWRLQSGERHFASRECASSALVCMKDSCLHQLSIGVEGFVSLQGCAGDRTKSRSKCTMYVVTVPQRTLHMHLDRQSKFETLMRGQTRLELADHHFVIMVSV